MVYKLDKMRIAQTCDCLKQFDRLVLLSNGHKPQYFCYPHTGEERVEVRVPLTGRAPRVATTAIMTCSSDTMQELLHGAHWTCNDGRCSIW